jgi:hypothetical protein
MKNLAFLIESSAGALFTCQILFQQNPKSITIKINSSFNTNALAK